MAIQHRAKTERVYVKVDSSFDPTGFIPSGQDIMMAGDSVLVVLSGYRISDIKEILED